MPLPEKVIIGPLSFRVTDAPMDHMIASLDDMNKSWGVIKYASGTITLGPEQTDSHKRMTLLHEVMHGCWHIGDRSHKNDEKAIRALAAPLLDVLRRNPDLVAYLLEDEDNPDVGRPVQVKGS